VACTLLFSSGCTNSVSIKSKDTNPFILELDKAGLNFQSGNQLACIYQYKYLDLTMGQLDGKNYLDDLVDGVPLPQFIEEGIAEAKRRVAENADTNLRDAISRDSSNWTDVCSVYGEMDPNTGWWNPNVPEIDATQEFQTGDESIDAGSFVWQRNLDMTGVGTWAERPREDWKEDVGQQYLFVNKVNCLFYVFDENSKDRDLMQRAYQWLSQYSGVHIAGPTWILMDSSYGEKCTGPVTDALGGYRLN
jgi:hypothetical protein